MLPVPVHQIRLPQASGVRERPVALQVGRAAYRLDDFGKEIVEVFPDLAAFVPTNQGKHESNQNIKSYND